MEEEQRRMETDATSIRPTKSVVRKALRDMFRPVINGLTVLDLFAGTGQVGSELLEEGARKVFAVDSRPRPEQLAEEDVEWYQQEVMDFLSFGPPEPVDLVFLDPPYGSEYPNEVLGEAAEAPWLKQQGLVVIETGRDYRLPEQDPENGRLQLIRKRRYGDTRIWVYQADREVVPEFD